VEVGERRLALSEHESVELLRFANPVLADASVADLSRRCEGWLAGLLLAAQAGGVVPDRVELGRGGPHAGYLVEEVLGHQDPRVQEFLLRTSVLERFTPRIAAAVAGCDDARAIIDDLLARHLFTIPLDAGGEWYRYHHLFRAVLLQALEDRGPTILASDELHRLAAAAWLDEGDSAEAARHLLAAGDQEAAAEALEPVAERMAASSGANVLSGLLGSLSRQVWRDRPRLVLAHATLLFAQGQHEASFSEIEHAIETLLAAGDDDRAAAALFRLFQAMLGAGTHADRRIEVGRRYLDRIDPAAETLPLARMFHAAGYGYASRFGEAREEIRTALALPAAHGSRILPIYAAVFDAFYVRSQTEPMRLALAQMDEALGALLRHEAEDLLSFVPFARMLRAYILNDLGLYEESLAEAERAHEEAARRGVERAFSRIRDWVRGVALAGLGRWDESQGSVDHHPLSGQGGEPTSYTYRTRVLVARAAAQRGDPASAALIAAARTEMQSFGHVSDMPYHLGDLALAAHAAGLAEIAADICEDLVVVAEEGPSPWFAARAHLLSAALCGSHRAADEHLARALALTHQWSLDDLWLRRERAFAATLLARAVARTLGPPGMAARLAVACGPDVLAEVARVLHDVSSSERIHLADALGRASAPDPMLLRRLLDDPEPTVREAAEHARIRMEARPRPSLRILTMGRFAVLRGGVVVPDLAFGRQKARVLLALLVTRGEPVHREVIVDWLWPHLAPDKARQSLHSTLYALRRAVDLGVGRGAQSLIQTDGEAYLVELGPGDEWDAGHFLALARRAAEPGSVRERIEWLMAAEAAYTGTFLPEWPYDEWAAARRNEVQGTYERLVEDLAEALLAGGRPGPAIERASRLVGLDEEREGWHRLLMRAYAAAGERPRALRQYHALRTVLRERLGMEPGCETRDLYRSLL
jgi:DNA-binding SARP family transcriptional activator/tetratricopeptide (TPR) repeat protein